MSKIPLKERDVISQLLRLFDKRSSNLNKKNLEGITKALGETELPCLSKNPQNF